MILKQFVACAFYTESSYYCSELLCATHIFDYFQLIKDILIKEIYFAIYNPAANSIEIYSGTHPKIVLDCSKINGTIYLDDSLDISIKRLFPPLSIHYFNGLSL